MADSGLNIPVTSSADLKALDDLNAKLKVLQDQGMSTQAAFKQLGLSWEQFLKTGSVEPIKQAAQEVKGLGDSFIFSGGSLAKFRAEAVTLFREMAAGGNTTRTLGALISSLNPAVAAFGVAAFVVARQIISLNEEMDKWVEQTLKANDAVRKQQQSLLDMQDAFRKAQLIGAMPLREKIEALWQELQRLKTEQAAANLQTAEGVEEAKKLQTEIERTTLALERLRQEQYKQIEAEIQADARRANRVVQREETERWVKVTEEFNAMLREQNTALQSIRETQQLINANPFAGIDEKQRALAESYDRELVTMKLDLDKLRESAASGFLNPEQLARVNAEISKTEFTIQRMTLDMAKLAQPLRAELQQWANSFGSVATQIGHTIQQTINASLETLNQFLVTGKFNAQELERQIILLGLRLVEQMLIQAAISRINQAQATASAQTAAAAVGAAWAAPATAVTTATEGQAAYQAPEAFGIALAAIQAMMGLGQAMSSGGSVGGTGTSDSVPAMLAPGEFVINRESAQSIGYENLHMMNAYERGGVVAPGRSYYQDAPTPDIYTGTDPFAEPYPPSTEPPSYSPPEDTGGGIPELPGVTTGENPPYSPGTTPSPPVDLPGVTVFGPGSPGIPVVYGGGRGGRGGPGAIFHGLWSGHHPYNLANFNNMLGWINYQGWYLGGRRPRAFGGYNYSQYLSMWHALRNAHMTAPMGGYPHGILGSATTGGGHRVAFQKGGVVGGSGIGGVHIYAFTDLKQLTKHMASREGQKIIFDTVNGRRIDLGIG